MVRALVTKIILHLNQDLYNDFVTSETLSKMCLLKKGTLPFLDLQYIYSHLSSHKHHVHSNLSHQFTQHQHYDWEHLNKSHPVNWIKDVCVAQMLWEAFSLKLFPLLENKDWSHLKQRARELAAANMCLPYWSSNEQPEYHLIFIHARHVVLLKGCAMPITLCSLQDSILYIPKSIFSEEMSKPQGAILYKKGAVASFVTNLRQTSSLSAHKMPKFCFFLIQEKNLYKVYWLISSHLRIEFYSFILNSPLDCLLGWHINIFCYSQTIWTRWATCSKISTEREGGKTKLNKFNLLTTKDSKYSSAIWSWSVWFELRQR